MALGAVGVLVVATNEVKGREIEQVLGLAFRGRGPQLRPDLGATWSPLLRSLDGGEIKKQPDMHRGCATGRR